MLMSQQIAVIGLGNWGTALANHLAVKGYDVLGWCLEADIAQSINQSNLNARYLTSVTLSKNLKATNDLELALKCNIIVIVFPSSVLGIMTPKLKVSSDTIIVSAIKGLEKQSLLTPLQFIDGVTGTHSLAVLSGPSFAKDVVIQKPVGVVSASADLNVAKKVAEIFSSPTMRVYAAGDPLGVEIGSVVKNVIALAAGVSDGLGLGESAKAGLITRGLAEMRRLAVAMGAQERTLFGLSGLGDLVLTATCDTSRNRTVGLRLGRGETLKQIVESLGSVAEAVSTAPLVLALAEKHKVEMPITAEVAKLVESKVSAQDVVRNLLSRPATTEF